MNPNVQFLNKIKIKYESKKIQRNMSKIILNRIKNRRQIEKTASDRKH